MPHNHGLPAENELKNEQHPERHKTVKLMIPKEGEICKLALGWMV